MYEFDAEVDEFTLTAGEGVFLEGAALVTGPARLAWIVEAKTWEPVLGVCVDVVASESPGSANCGTAIAIDVMVSRVLKDVVVAAWRVNKSGCTKVAPAFVRGLGHDLIRYRQGATLD